MENAGSLLPTLPTPQDWIVWPGPDPEKAQQKHNQFGGAEDRQPQGSASPPSSTPRLEMVG